MPKRRGDESPLEQGQRDTQVRRDTAIRGSMGTPASGKDEQKVTPESDLFKDEPESTPEQERARGSAPQGPGRPASVPRQPGKLPLPD